MNKDNKKFIVETIFLRESLKHEISLHEFLVLMYFDNEYEQVFDVKKVSKAVCLSEEDVLNAFGILLEKKLISLKSVKDDKTGKYFDKVCLDNLYNKIQNTIEEKTKEKEKEDFFSNFQKSYSHSLNSMDYEIINAWLTSGFSEELIMTALEIANENNVTSLRYIDKILYEWKKKGIKTKKDMDDFYKKNNNSEQLPKFEAAIFEYNWLDENR